MRYFSRFSPRVAYHDLRFFLGLRQPHELWFLVAAMAITGFLIFAFFKDSYVEREYRPQITYVQQWPADRTDAQIRAQQAIDGPIKRAALAEQRAAEAKRRAEFKKVDDALTKWGI
ncbi:MAG TPA: hypothetical protein VF695_13700 [Sphingomonas sp.]